MDQKIKLSIAAAAALVIIIGAMYFMQRKTDEQTIQPLNNIQTEQSRGADKEISEPVDANQGSINEVSGKIRSINEKAVYIELADGKGYAANIKPTTPVITLGVADPGTLADLKAGQNVSVKVDKAGNAIQILIKK